MPGGKLTSLLQRILRALARLDPPWTLTGGGALALAWVLKDFAAGPLARGLGWSEEECGEIVAFQQRLVERLVAAGAPE